MAAIKLLVDILVEDKVFKEDQIERARQQSSKHNQRISSALIELGYCGSQELASFVAKKYGLPFADLSKYQVPNDAIRSATKYLCEKFMIMPLAKNGVKLTLGFSDPIVLSQAEQIASALAHKIEFVVVTEEQIKNAISVCYNHESGTKTNIINSDSKSAGIPSPQSSVKAPLDTTVANKNLKPGNLKDKTQSSKAHARVRAQVAPAKITSERVEPIAFVNTILAEAVSHHVSDIHIEVFDKKFRVRFRVDGGMQEVFACSHIASAIEIVSRIKVLAKMDISEKRRPLDGRIRFQTNTKEGYVDMRVNSMPTMFGEKIVMRLLDSSTSNKDIAHVGFTKSQLRIVEKILNYPQGMILVTGPTGSGKTTTIYSALHKLNTLDTNISTAEDPVEFVVEGINQLQVNADIGLTFSEALRAFLRQDPDVIMVGEIRDLDTANISYKAASTGHLVLSTLHTNDAISTIRRLIDMGIAPLFVAEGTSMITAQRLLRCICTHCRHPQSIEKDELMLAGVSPDQLSEFGTIYKGEGCEKCNYTGLKGRTAVHEVLEITSSVRDGIIRGVPMHELRQRAINSGMITLRAAALEKMREGVLSLQEVIAGTMSDESGENG